MFVTDFEYAGKRLSDLGYSICHINTESGLREVDIGCDITFNTVKNNHSSKHYITSSTYENMYSTTFEIIKNPCLGNYEDMIISSAELSMLMKWLHRRNYEKLKFMNVIEHGENINYFGSFNAKEIINGDDLIGLALTFTANAPYGFGDEITLTYSLSSTTKKFEIYGLSDEIGRIYPTVEIKFNAAYDEFSLLNITTGNKVFLKNCKKNETIVLDGETKIIATNDTSHTTLYQDFNYEFLDILIEENDFSLNEYEVSNPCSVIIKYSPIRKVGVM